MVAGLTASGPNLNSTKQLRKMSKTVLKNTQRHAVVKIVTENTVDITHADLSFDVTVESGDNSFGGSGSKGVATRTQVPAKMEIAKVIYSNAGSSNHIDVKRAADTVMVLGGSGEFDFEGQVVEDQASNLPITIAASTSGHKYTVYVFINKIGVQ